MITTKGRYAVRFMLELSGHPEGTPVPLDEIASNQEISKKYLESVVKLLVTGKLVKGASGKKGGYCLLRKPSEYTIGEILSAAEGPLHTVACLQDDAEPCPRHEFCLTLPMWKKYDALVHDFFFGITLEDLKNGNI